MNENEKDLSPQWMEEPLEPSSPEVAENHLTQDLQYPYQTYIHANRASLLRVQERLNAYLKSTQQDAETIRIKNRKYTGEKYTMNSISSITVPKKRWGHISHTLSTIAAVLIVTLLVGSMIFVLNSRRSEQRSIAGASEHNGSSPGIYMVIQKNNTAAVSKADTQTHKVLWTHSEPNITISSPLTIADTTVYYDADSIAKSIHSSVYALNADTGAVRWKANFVDSLSGSKMYQGDIPNSLFLTQPIYANGSLYVMTGTGKVVALDANNGKVLWTYESGVSAQVGTSDFSGNLWVANNTVYGVLHNKLFALDAYKGKEIWQPVQIEQNHLFDGVQVVNNVLYTASRIASVNQKGTDQESYIYAFDAKRGIQIWRYHTPAYITGIPTIAGGNIYFQGHGPAVEKGQLSGCALYALNAQGVNIWHQNFSANSDLAGPIVDNGLLYISDNIYTPDGSKLLSTTLLALHSGNGSEAWSTQATTDPIQVANGILYTSNHDGLIATYGAKSGGSLEHILFGDDRVNKNGSHQVSWMDFVVVP